MTKTIYALYLEDWCFRTLAEFAITVVPILILKKTIQWLESNGHPGNPVSDWNAIEASCNNILLKSMEVLLITLKGRGVWAPDDNFGTGRQTSWFSLATQSLIWNTLKLGPFGISESIYSHFETKIAAHIQTIG